MLAGRVRVRPPSGFSPGFQPSTTVPAACAMLLGSRAFAREEEQPRGVFVWGFPHPLSESRAAEHPPRAHPECSSDADFSALGVPTPDTVRTNVLTGARVQ